MVSTPPPDPLASDRLPAPDRALTDAFTACLPDSGPLRGPLVAFRELSSTQLVARAWAREGRPEGAVCLADHQTEGRGQRGRRWIAPPATALLWSCLLRPPLAPRRWPELSILAGCAVAEAVEAVTGLPARLRWPNDVLVNGRKVAGVLAEGVVGNDPAVVLGIGINVLQSEEDWSAELRSRAASLATLGAPAERTTVFRTVLARLGTGYERLLVTGFESVRQTWRARALIGEPILTGSGGSGEAGTVEDLEPGGGLLVRRADGRLETIVAASHLA
jgi:BirA family biotin operon repressor/biotin-[acetyl-CoA-carboxylase] ligase